MNTPIDSDNEAKADDASAATYNTNPIMIVISGLERLFTYAKPIGIALLVLSLLLAVLNFSFNPGTAVYNDTEVSYGGELEATAPISGFDITAIVVVAAIVLLLLAGIVTLSILVFGILDITSAAAARGRKITAKEAFSGLFEQFWPYAKLRILMFFKLFLWSLLFVLPAIYFSYRYYLSGVVFFAEGKKGNTAIKESLRLTKGAWLTTFASYSIINVLTLGVIQTLTDTGTSAELYRNYRDTVDSSQKHPRPHWLSWVFIGLFIVMIVSALVFMAAGVGYYIDSVEPGPSLPVQSI